MIGWSQIIYGATLSALAAAALTAALIRPRTPLVIATAAVASFAGPVAWNAILRAAHGREFFTDAPVAVLPASWQDTGSGVFALAAAALLFGLLGPLAAQPSRKTIAAALLCALAAFAVDVYLY